MGVLLYGSDYWDQVVHFDKLLEWEMISPEDLSLFQVRNTPEEAFEVLKQELSTSSSDEG